MRPTLAIPARLPLSNAVAGSGSVGKLRDSMTFTDEWHVDGVRDGKPVSVTVRMYSTRGGTYGPQFRAILWVIGAGDVGPWVGMKTTGGGYDKKAEAAATALHAAGLSGVSAGRSPIHQIAEAFGIEADDIHHAHG